MGQPDVQTAAKLLAKAQSTTSPPEAIALVERSYGLLARVITAYDQANDCGPRRRERRLLPDRRRRDRATAAGGARDNRDMPCRAAESVDRYRRAAADGGYSFHRDVDMVL
ncbi:MAG TPA: hypothetical protein VMV22_11395 [Acidimicrobiales bacterium]|nr:hypothetical protein [Acidimicrobiales bacterium]